MPATPQCIGFAVASRRATFPSPSETPVGQPSPAPLRYGFMRSGFLSSSKSLRRFSRSPLVRATIPAGVSSLFATSPTASTPSRAPHRSLSTPVQLTEGPTLPLRSVHRFSQPRDGLLRLRIRGLVSSRCHVQGYQSVQGFLPMHSGTRLIAGPCLPTVAARPLAGDPAAVNAPLGFEALFRTPKRSSGSGFSHSPRSLPSSASASLRLSLHHREPASAGHPLVTLSPQPPHVPPPLLARVRVLAASTRLQRIAGSFAGASVSAAPSRTRFRAFRQCPLRSTVGEAP